MLLLLAEPEALKLASWLPEQAHPVNRLQPAASIPEKLRLCLPHLRGQRGALSLEAFPRSGPHTCSHHRYSRRRPCGAGLPDQRVRLPSRGCADRRRRLLEHLVMASSARIRVARCCWQCAAYLGAATPDTTHALSVWCVALVGPVAGPACARLVLTLLSLLDEIDEMAGRALFVVS